MDSISNFLSTISNELSSPLPTATPPLAATAPPAALNNAFVVAADAGDAPVSIHDLLRLTTKLQKSVEKWKSKASGALFLRALEVYFLFNTVFVSFQLDSKCGVPRPELALENTSLKSELDIQCTRLKKLEATVEELNMIVQSSAIEREVWKSYIRDLEIKVADPPGDALIEQLRAQHAHEKSELMNEIEVAYARVASTELEGAEWRAQLEQSRERFALEKQSCVSYSVCTLTSCLRSFTCTMYSYLSPPGFYIHHSAVDAVVAAQELGLADALIAQETQLLIERESALTALRLQLDAAHIAAADAQTALEDFRIKSNSTASQQIQMQESLQSVHISALETTVYEFRPSLDQVPFI